MRIVGNWTGKKTYVSQPFIQKKRIERKRDRIVVAADLEVYPDPPMIFDLESYLF